MPLNIESSSVPYKDIMLNLDQIKITSNNKYNMSDLEDLASSILMDGLQEPLIVGLVDGKYMLCSGHRRTAALKLLVSEGHTEVGKNISCRYKEMNMLQLRLALLVGNSFNRKMTDYDLMMQAAEWKEVLTEAKKEKMLILEAGERVRDYVAKVLGESSTKVAQLDAINNNAVLEVKKQFENGNMGITAAYEASRLEEAEQVEAARQAEEEAQSENKKKKRKTKEDEVKEQNTSDTDTPEEEKEKARKLHAVKMIEKYYLYLSDEEVEILERILEDCKRRKREYALPED